MFCFSAAVKLCILCLPSTGCTIARKSLSLTVSDLSHNREQSERKEAKLYARCRGDAAYSHKAADWSQASGHLGVVLPSVLSNSNGCALIKCKTYCSIRYKLPVNVKWVLPVPLFIETRTADWWKPNESVRLFLKSAERWLRVAQMTPQTTQRMCRSHDIS